MVSVPRTAFGHSIDKHELTLSLSRSLPLLSPSHSANKNIASGFCFHKLRRINSAFNRVCKRQQSSRGTSSICFSFCSCTSALTLRCFYLLGWGACLRLCLTRRIYNSIDFQLLFVKYATAFTLGQLFFAHTVRSFCVCEMCVRLQSLIMKHIN